MSSFLVNLTGGTHGTKILGSIVAAIGVFTAASPDTLTAILGPKGPAIAVLVGGVLTAIRGFLNSNAAPPAAK